LGLHRLAVADGGGSGDYQGPAYTFLPPFTSPIYPNKFATETFRRLINMFVVLSSRQSYYGSFPDSSKKCSQAAVDPKPSQPTSTANPLIAATVFTHHRY